MINASTNTGSGDLTWFKSSYSGSDGGECLEVAACPSAVHVRDSKNPEGPALALSPAAWASFTEFAVQRRSAS